MIPGTKVNDQPISATFFRVSKGLTEFVTPDALAVKTLYEDITWGIDNQQGRITALWQWVASKVRYTRFVSGRLNIEGKTSVQNDCWVDPATTAAIRVGNCATKSFLLASLLRNELPSDRIHCVLGNLNQPGNRGGHAWVEVQPNGAAYIMESTRADMQPMVLAKAADIYEQVVYFNDQEVAAIEGRTVLQPFTAVYVDWLKDYLDWQYINGGKH